MKRKPLVPLTGLSDFNPSSFKWWVAEGDEVGFPQRVLSWSFREDEVPDFDFIVEARLFLWLRDWFGLARASGLPILIRQTPRQGTTLSNLLSGRRVNQSHPVINLTLPSTGLHTNRPEVGLPSARHPLPPIDRAKPCVDPAVGFPGDSQRSDPRRTSYNPRFAGLIRNSIGVTLLAPESNVPLDTGNTPSPGWPFQREVLSAEDERHWPSKAFPQTFNHDGKAWARCACCALR